MDINGSSRSQLKAYFIKHAIPSEGQFTELIDGMLNQRDDRIVKAPGSPLSLEAAGDPASRRQALHLYESFDDTDPAWALTMNPRATVSDPTTAKRGLSIDDASGISRLFVDHETGQVGIGTIEPEATLHVNGEIMCNNVSMTDPPLWQPVTLEAGYVGSAGHAAPGYLKDSNGIVYLRGTVATENNNGDISHVTPENTVTLFTLPSNCCPAGKRYFVVFSHGEKQSDIYVMPDGRVMLGYRLQKNGFSLDNIIFPAARGVYTPPA